MFNNGHIHPLGSPIKVMVVDHNSDYLASISAFLNCHSFEVTCVDQAGVALKVLLENKNKFDLVLIDSNMRDVDVITFLRLIKNMDILSMVICQGIDDNSLLKVLENGGFRVLNAMLTSEVVMHIRQDVIRTRVVKFEQLKMSGESETSELEGGSHQVRRYDGRARRKRVEKPAEIREVSHDESLETVQINNRVCVKWTPQLHSKFVKAYHGLPPEKRCPKAILEAMGVPGLTRLQIASHLQKYEKEMRRKNRRRRGATSSSNNTMSSSNLFEGVNLGTVGNILGVTTHVENHAQIVTTIDNTVPSNGGQADVNNQFIVELLSMNGSGLEIFDDEHFVPADSNQNSGASNEISDDFFESLGTFFESMEFNETVANYNINIISEQILPDQITPELNQDIYQQSG